MSFFYVLAKIPKLCEPCKDINCKSGYVCVANFLSCAARCERGIPIYLFGSKKKNN